MADKDLSHESTTTCRILVGVYFFDQKETAKMWSTNRSCRMVRSCAIFLFLAGFLHSGDAGAQETWTCTGTLPDGLDWKYEGELKDKNNCETRHGSGSIWWTRNGKPSKHFTGHWVDGWLTSGILYYDDEFGTQHEGTYQNNRTNGNGERRYTKGKLEGVSLRGSWANEWLQSVSSATLPKRLSTMSTTKLLILADEWAQAGDANAPAAIYRWITANTDGPVALKAADRLRDHLADLRRRAEMEERANVPAPPVATYKFDLGDSVKCLLWKSNSGWYGTVEDKRDDRYQIRITSVVLNGFLAMGLKESACTGNVFLDYSSRGTYIWVPKYCVE